MFCWRKFAALILLACVIALANVGLRTERPPWANDTLLPGEIRMATLRAAADNILWVDMRADGTTTAIPHAIVLSENAFDDSLPELLSRWQAGVFIVVVAGKNETDAAHGVAERLRNEVGLDNVYVMKGGADAWQAGAK